MKCLSVTCFPLKSTLILIESLQLWNSVSMLCVCLSFHFALCLSKGGLLVDAVQLVLLLTGVCRLLIFNVTAGKGGFNLPSCLVFYLSHVLSVPFPPLFLPSFGMSIWVNYVFVSIPVLVY